MRSFFLGWVVVLIGCGADATAPQVEVGGIEYTARLHNEENGAGQAELTVIVTLRNVNGSPVVSIYPRACPVLAQVLRNSDNVPVYDETRLPCDITLTDTVTIDFDPVVLTRTRLVSQIAGDSISHGVYRVNAAVLTNGAQPVIVGAGTFNLH
jgi:hypothetical protein